MNNIATPIIASVSCASLAWQMWRSANKVASSKRAQDQVFRAVKKVFPPIQERQKREVVARFERGVRTGAFVVGGTSLFFGVKVLLRLI